MFAKLLAVFPFDFGDEASTWDPIAEVLLIFLLVDQGPPETGVTLDVDGNLVITDVGDGDSQDTITIQLDEISYWLLQ